MKKFFKITFLLFYSIGFSQTQDTIKLNTLEDTKELFSNNSQRNLIGRVLVAEDHPENRQLIKRILERMGLTVVAVENGRDAAQATLDEQFDLILLDIQS